MDKENKVLEDWIDKQLEKTFVDLSDDYKECENLSRWYQEHEKITSEN